MTNQSTETTANVLPFKAARKPRSDKGTTRAANKAIKAKVKAQVAKITDEDETEEKAPASVVAPKFKAKYAAKGDPRNCGDWLAKVLKDAVLDEDRHLDVARLQRIAKMNGVSPEYDNRSPGWQGRMRMTIGLRMRPVIAAKGEIYVPEGRSKKAIPAPTAFVKAYLK